MRSPDSSSQWSNRQRIWVGSAIGGVILIVIVLALVRLVRQESPTPPSTEIPLETPQPMSPGESSTITLFYVASDGDSLVEEQRVLFLSETLLERMEQVLQEFIQGSAKGLVSSLPVGTELNDVFRDKRGIVYLNFSSELSRGHPGGTTAERLTVEAILQTVLTNFPRQVRKVQILVDGSEVETLTELRHSVGHIDISRPLTTSTAVELKP